MAQRSDDYQLEVINRPPQSSLFQSHSIDVVPIEGGNEDSSSSHGDDDGPPVLSPPNISTSRQTLVEPAYGSSHCGSSGSARQRHTTGSAVVIDIDHVFEFRSRPEFKRANCQHLGAITPKRRGWSLRHGPHALFTAHMRTYTSSYLEMDSLQTHSSRKRSANKTHTTRNMIQLLGYFPFFNLGLEVCVLNHWLTQHNIVAVQEFENVYRMQYTMASFVADVAGEWRYPRGDVLVVPRKDPDVAAELLVSLADVISGLRSVHKLEGTYATGLEVTDVDDADFRILRVQSKLASSPTLVVKSIFKPLFYPMCFKLANHYSCVKAILALDLLQKCCVIFIQLCDMAVVAKEPVKALLMAQCAHTCIFIIDVILQRGDLLHRPMAYTHFMAHYLLANRYYELLMASTDYKQDFASYVQAKLDLEPFFAALEGFQKDFPMALENTAIMQLTTLPKVEQLCVQSKYYFKKLKPELLIGWKRASMRTYHVGTLKQLGKLRGVCSDLMRPGNASWSQLYAALQTADDKLNEITLGDAINHRAAFSEDIYLVNKFLSSRCCKYKAMFRFPIMTAGRSGSGASTPDEPSVEGAVAMATGATNSVSLSLGSCDDEDPSTCSSNIAVAGSSRLPHITTSDSCPLIDPNSVTSTTPSAERGEGASAATSPDGDESPEFSGPRCTPSTAISGPRSEVTSGIATPAGPAGYNRPERFDQPMGQEHYNNFITMETFQLSALDVFRAPGEALVKTAHLQARKQFLCDQIIFLLELEYRGVKDEKRLCSVTSLTLALRHAMAAWESNPFLPTANAPGSSSVFRMGDSTEDLAAFDEMIASYCAALSVLFLLKSCRDGVLHRRAAWQSSATYYHQVTALYMQQKTVPGFLLQLFADYVNLAAHCYRAAPRPGDQTTQSDSGGGGSSGNHPGGGGVEGSPTGSVPQYNTLATAMHEVKRQLCLLRRMMPLLPVLWEYSVVLDKEGPVNYDHVMLDELVLPFSELERKRTLAPVDSNILDKVQKQMGERNLGLNESSKRYLKCHDESYLEPTAAHRNVIEGLAGILMTLPMNSISSPEDAPAYVEKVGEASAQMLAEFFKVPEVESNVLRSGCLESWHQRAITTCSAMTRMLMSFAVGIQNSTANLGDLLNCGAISTTVAIVVSVLSLLHADKTLDTEDLTKTFPELIVATLTGDNHYENTMNTRQSNESNVFTCAVTLRAFFSISENDRIPASDLKPHILFKEELQKDIASLLRSAERIEFGNATPQETVLTKTFLNLLLSLDCFNECSSESISLSDVVQTIAQTLVRSLTGVYYKHEQPRCITSEYTASPEMDLVSRKSSNLVSPLRKIFLARIDLESVPEQHLTSPCTNYPPGGSKLPSTSGNSIESNLHVEAEVFSRPHLPGQPLSPATPPTSPVAPPKPARIFGPNRNLEQFYDEDERACRRCDFFSMSHTIRGVFGDVSCRATRYDIGAILAGVRRSLVASLRELLATQQLVMGRRIDESLVEEGVTAILLDSPLFISLTQLEGLLDSEEDSDLFVIAHALHELDKLLFNKVHSQVLRGQTPLEEV